MVQLVRFAAEGCGGSCDVAFMMHSLCKEWNIEHCEPKSTNSSRVKIASCA